MPYTMPKLTALARERMSGVTISSGTPNTWEDVYKRQGRDRSIGARPMRKSRRHAASPLPSEGVARARPAV